MRNSKYGFSSAKYFLATSLLFLCVLLCYAQPETRKRREPKPKTIQYKRWLFSPGIGAHLADSTTVASLGCYTRFNLFRAYSDFSASLACPVSVGYNLTSSSLLFEAPVLAEANFGHLATKNSFGKIGFSFGVGYSYFMLANKLSSGISSTICFRWFMIGLPFSFRLLSTFADDDNVPFLGSAHLSISPGEWRKKNRDLNKVSKFSAPYRK